MIFTKALPVRLRALWFGVSIISSIWFLYWICYDVIVWNKALTQARPENYVGLTVSIVLAILGTQLGKGNVFERVTLPIEQNVRKKPAENQETLEGEQIRPIELLQQIQTAKEETTQIASGSIIPSGCKFYLGYLHTRPESVEIPEECLGCEYVVECLSPTSSAINARV